MFTAGFQYMLFKIDYILSDYHNNKAMIRHLHENLGIPAEALIRSTTPRQQEA
jgi:hypothetical protein